jgi:hypothetical protein
MLRRIRGVTIRLLALYLRRSRIDTARWRLVPCALREIRALCAAGRKTVRTRRGFRMICDLQEWLGQHVYVTGDWEDSTSAIIQTLVRPGDAVIDIGANAGTPGSLPQQLFAVA